MKCHICIYWTPENGCDHYGPETLPTNNGQKTIPQIMDSLQYSSYAANRDYGMTHAQLLSIGIGNDGMKFQYESENFTKQVPND